MLFGGGIVLEKRGSNISTIKKANISLILRHLRNQSLSCIELSKLTGLSKSAVTTITKQMLSLGYLEKTGTEITEYGRHPVLLDIIKDYRYAFGISLHRKEIAACVVNLKFEPIEIRAQSVTAFATPQAAVDWAYDACIDIMNAHSIDPEKILGIGIASPGPLDCQKGIILNPPNFPLVQNFPIAEFLSHKTKYPVFLSNVSVLMTMYEKQIHLPEVKNFVFVIVDKGVGSAIMTDDKIYRGKAGLAGEIGHISIEQNGNPCACGNKGCLETYITKHEIEKKFQLPSYEQMIDNAYNGNQHSLEIVDYIAACFGCGIINIINLLDIEAIVISGELNYRHELLFSKIQEYINRHCIVAHFHPVKLLPSVIQSQNIAYSAAMVLDKYYLQEL